VGSVGGLAPGECYTFCGTTQTLDNWEFAPNVPAVSGISPSTGPTAGGLPIAITGSGFTSGSTVNFVEESGNTPSSSNVVVASPSVAVNSQSSITAVSPAVTAGTTYFVVVTTPNGSSPYQIANTSPPQYVVFTY
jgi:large repetitive protein